MKRLHAFAVIGVLSLFLVPALSVFAADIDSGLRIQDSTGTVHVAGSNTLSDSKLHLKTSTGVEGILLVPPTDPLASKAKINTSAGIMAFKKFVPAPSAPTGLATTSVACGGNVGLTWNSVATTKSYKVYKNGTLATTTTGTTFSDSGLTGSTSYTYTVTASNDAGDSAAATIIAISSGSCVPSVPTIVVTPDPTCGGRIIISWSAVPSATNYKIYRNGTLATTTASTVYTDTGLTVSTSYTYTVVASNASGDSPASTAGSATSSPKCAPDQPVVTATTDTQCGGRSVLQWPAVATAVSYKIYRTDTASSTTVLATTTIPTVFPPGTIYYTDIAPLTSRQYSYTVVATNSSNVDSATSTASVATSSQICANIVQPSTSGNCGSQILVSWPPANDAQIYKLYRSTSTSGPWTLSTSTTLALTNYVDTAPSPSVIYYYIITTANGRGGYATSTALGALSSIACVPNAPSSITITPNATCGSNSIAISWTVPTGSIAATGYKLYRSDVVNPIYTGTALTYTNTGLTPNVNYTYTVYATNAAGSSVSGTTKSGTSAVECVPSLTAYTRQLTGGVVGDLPYLGWKTLSTSNSCVGIGNDGYYDINGTYHPWAGPQPNSAIMSDTSANGAWYTHTGKLYTLVCSNGSSQSATTTLKVGTGSSVAPTKIPAVATLSFVPNRTSSGDIDRDTATGVVNGTIQYACNAKTLLSTPSSAPKNSFTSSDPTEGLILEDFSTPNTTYGSLFSYPGSFGTVPKANSTVYTLTCNTYASAYDQVTIHIQPSAAGWVVY